MDRFQEAADAASTVERARADQAVNVEAVTDYEAEYVAGYLTYCLNRRFLNSLNAINVPTFELSLEESEIKIGTIENKS